MLLAFFVAILPARAAFPEAKPLLFGAAAVLVSLPLDAKVRDWMQGDSPFADKVADFTNNFGDGRYLGAGLLGLGLGGLVFKSRKLKRTALEAGEAFLIAGGITNFLKTVTMRKRPSEAASPFEFEWGSRSFPSGHVTVATAVFTVFAKESNLKILYIIPALTAFARMRKNAHWLSDTVAGATVGYVVASFVVRKGGFIFLSPTRGGFIITVALEGGANASGL